LCKLDGKHKKIAALPRLRLQQLTCKRLESLDLDIGAAQIVCLSGASGSGKSTLLRAIADLDPHQGQVWLDDREQNSVAPPQWRSWIGMLAAESLWWFDSVKPHFARLEQEWLEMLGFELRVLDWQVSRLSSGERQRLALLRLLSHTPRALLLDEPSANLDAENTKRIEALIQHYADYYQAPVLWISHDADQIARVAQRHYRLEAGRLVRQEMSL
jgi:ABC-type iron transport system FetAB ATPase subunit